MLSSCVDGFENSSVRERDERNQERPIWQRENSLRRREREKDIRKEGGYFQFKINLNAQHVVGCLKIH